MDEVKKKKRAAGEAAGKPRRQAAGNSPDGSGASHIGRAPALERLGTAAEPAIELAGHLHSAAIHLLRRLRVRDRESGVGPAQLSALSVLVFGGAKSLGELAEAENVKAPTMSRIVAGLERARLVRRFQTEDRRRVRLEATAKGNKIMWEGRRRRVESLAKVLAVLPEEEREKLKGVIPLLQELIRKI